MGRRKRTYFDESAWLNNSTYIQYYQRLTELAVSMFEWKRLPETVDERFLEMALFHRGKAVFFRDDATDDYLALYCADGGPFNVYNIPIKRRAYASNGYNNNDLTDKNSVIIYNNFVRTNSVRDARMFATRLYNLDRIIDVNANAQKTPVLLQCSENDRLTLVNVYKEYDGNAPVIYGGKNLDLTAIKSVSTGAPYVADKIYMLKQQIWNEALTYLGITNVNFQKKERMIASEVGSQQGSVVANRHSRLEMRRKACREINRMFGLNIWCDYREEFMDETVYKKDGEEDE